MSNKDQLCKDKSSFKLRPRRKTANFYDPEPDNSDSENVGMRDTKMKLGFKKIQRKGDRLRSRRTRRKVRKFEEDQNRGEYSKIGDDLRSDLVLLITEKKMSTRKVRIH
jgi:hypothetical protein